MMLKTHLHSERIIFYYLFESIKKMKLEEICLECEAIAVQYKTKYLIFCTFIAVY